MRSGPPFSRCYGGLCSLSVDDIQHLFESLAWHQWQHDYVSESFMRPSPLPYDSHAHSPCVYVITILITRMMYVLIANLLTMM